LKKVRPPTEEKNVLIENQAGQDHISDVLLLIAAFSAILITIAEYFAFVRFIEVLPFAAIALILGFGLEGIRRISVIPKAVFTILMRFTLIIVSYFNFIIFFSSSLMISLMLLIAVGSVFVCIVSPPRYYGYIFMIFLAILMIFQFRRLEGVAIFKASVFYTISAVWSFLWFRRPFPTKPFVLITLVFMLTAVMIPMKEGRYYPPTKAQLEAIYKQPGVDVLFSNKKSSIIPRYRKEIFCDPESGVLVVSPHSPDNFATLINPDGQKIKVDLGDEAPDQTYSDQGIWYTSNNSEFLEVDLRTGVIRSRVPCCTRFITYVRYDPDNDLLVLSRAGSDPHCLVASLRTAAPPSFRVLDIPGNEFLPFGNGKLLVGGEASVGLVDVESGQNEKVSRLPRNGIFYEVVPDRERGVIYAPDMFSGTIYVLQWDTLEVMGSFQASRGVRKVLPDPGGRFVFSGNYATGEIFKHALPGGEKVTSWIMGPLLRNLTWDCDGQSLLAVTSQGAFRIYPD